MAEADPVRHRLRLTGTELAAVVAVGAGQDGPEGGSRRLLVEALTAAGVLHGGALDGWVDRLLGVVARPTLRIAVEIVTTGRVVYPIWATPRDAVTGDPGSDGAADLSIIDPMMIPFAIAQTVGLRRRPPPPERPPIRVSVNMLAAVERRLVAGDAPNGPRQALRADGMPDDDAAALVDMVQRRRASWRASSVWADGSGRHSAEGPHILDAGDAGLWTVTVERFGSADPTQVFVLTAASVVWAGLLALLPGQHPAATDPAATDPAATDPAATGRAAGSAATGPVTGVAKSGAPT